MRKRGISEGGALGCGDVTPPALERRGCHKSGHPPRPLFQLRLFLAPIPQLETVLGGGWGRGPCHRKAGTKLWGAACPLASGAHLELEVIVAGGAFHGERLGEAKGEADEGQGADSCEGTTEGALPPPCIVRKDPRVPHTARQREETLRSPGSQRVEVSTGSGVCTEGE